MPWIVWRFYDVCLVVFAWSTWSFIWRMRGLGLVDERLAQVAELERTATRYREIAELLPHVVWTATGAREWSIFPTRRGTTTSRQRIARGWTSFIRTIAAACKNSGTQASPARRPVHFEARLQRAPTGYRAFLVRATAIAQGEAVKWLGACADIEDQKLLAAERELQVRRKSFFLNALSHDLRAPLHNVLLNAQLLKMSCDAGEPVDAEALDMIVENSVAAADLVAKLLDFAKVGAEDENVVEPVQLPGLLAQIVRRYAPLAEQKGLFLRKSEVVVANADVPASLQVATDRQKLERIISNLVENAIKYTGHGGVVLELATPAGTGAGGELCIRVRDSGIGIPHDKVPYLFDEFYQVNNYERDRSKGFGMGLAICRSLARHIGAEVRLAATGTDGSCFEVVLGGAGQRGDDGDGDGDDVGRNRADDDTRQAARRRR
jgi:signal transduction histidine kinase